MASLLLLPFAPEQPEHPGIGYLAVHDAVFAQRAFVDEAEFFQHAGRWRVARVDVGLDAVQVERGEALASCGVIEAVAQFRAAIDGIPFDQIAPADEHAGGGAVDGQARAGAFLLHLPARRDEAFGLGALFPGRRVPVAH